VSSIAVVGAVPPEAEGNGPRTAAALLQALERRGATAWPVLLADDAAVTQALESADVVVLVESRPVHAELARVARLGAGPARLVVVPPGYAFCEIATRGCARCPLRRGCPASDRVAIYRGLAQRAALRVFASPLHREASEEFLGRDETTTLVIAPPDVPALPDRAITADAVAFVGGDPLELRNVLEWATAHADRSLVIHGVVPPGIALPRNVTVRAPRGATGQLDAIAEARTLVMLPAHPVPFGVAAAAAVRAGRELVHNELLGLASHQLAAAGLDQALGGAADALAEAVLGTAARPRTGGDVRPATAGSVLLHVHHVGLGDSVNLWALARALLDAGTPVTYAVPDRHHELLHDQLPDGQVVKASAVDLAKARREHELIVEVTIRAGDAFAGDIVEERWLQLALERQPSPLVPMHEQFLALFARGGRALRPVRPSIRLAPTERGRGLAALRAAGIDPDRELVVAIHPGAGNPIKRWAPARFTELAGRLRELGARVVVVGGPGEEALVREVGEAGAALESCGAPLREVAALLASATLMVANDSGLMHLASAVGTPTLGIFGLTSERLWGPTHAFAAGVRARGVEPRAALAALTTDEVERAFVALARKVAGEPPVVPQRRIIPSPRLERVARDDGSVEWRGRAIVTSSGEDPIAPIVAACAAAPAWDDLTAAHDHELLAALLAAELILPTWATALQ
jgi:hypothetical protein